MMVSRIFRPWEFEKLRKAFRDEYLPLLDAQFLTCLRYPELIELQKHKEYFYGRTIELPKNRIVELSTMGMVIVSLIFMEKAPRYPKADTWDEMIRTAANKAGIDPIGMNANSFRKTWRAWIDFYYNVNNITTSYFTQEDRELMAKWCEGMV